MIGRACRLPGAGNVDEFWSLLRDGGCAVTRIPEDRWEQAQHEHPRRGEPGKSYTWSAGVLSDIWGFDPAVFGISPREAEQMDPQQRLLLELVWEALEDAQLPPADLAGKEVGVFVGASALDYANLRLFDPAAGDAYFATGNTLSLISNRISYAFDLHGPSLTIDTACSSSLVALHEATTAIQSGRIDTAIVAGVNVLASPFGFISFSRAAMLSPSGLCHAFDAKADGYVRAEGGVVLVLRALPHAVAADSLIHCVVAASGVNSDGRTVGVAMPSGGSQAALLDRVYRNAAIDLDRVAFIEAHGTGTKVGDPAEAGAIGEAIGRKRTGVLPIGSVKTNIGHLEPASGLVGVLKAMLALEHDMLPASLHCDVLNPEIPFAALNLDVCRRPLLLSRDGQQRFAGVNSFGFGGTNAHVVIADPPSAISKDAADPGEPKVMMLSAQSKAALETLVGRYRERFATAADAEINQIIAAAAYRRGQLSHRLAIPVANKTELLQTLANLESNLDTAAAAVNGKVVAREASTAFIYSGNGSQWPGMGREAYRLSEVFRKRFDKIDALFSNLSGWSLLETMFAEDIEQRLRLTSVAQPFLFAIQSATTVALRANGLAPDIVLGHSVGEIAAAETAGILDLEDAVRVIYFRSLHQELARDFGRMAVVFSAATAELIRDIEGLELAAFNNPAAFTVAGTAQALEALETKAAAEGIKIHRLDLDYPFHCYLMDPVEEPLRRDLRDLNPHPATLTFISTVDGTPIAGPQMDATYWWRNVREPVHFGDAVAEAARQGARIFVEIGPRHTLLSHIAPNVEPLGLPSATVGVLDRNPLHADPFPRAAMAAWVRGARIDLDVVAGRPPTQRVALPSYPWQRTPFRLCHSPEAIRFIAPESVHPLIGSRFSVDGLEWLALLDTERLPSLKDHRIGDQILLPGAAFVEMMLAAARQFDPSSTATISELELIQPLIFNDAASREIKTRISATTGVVEIFSRPRLSAVAWQCHATAKIIRSADQLDPPLLPAIEASSEVYGDRLYAQAAVAGLNFGPSFRQVISVHRHGEAQIVVDLAPSTASPTFGIDPARLDSCFHGLIVLFEETQSVPEMCFLPARFAEITLLQPSATPARALIDVLHANERSILANIALLDANGQLIVRLSGARFQAARVLRTEPAPAAIVQHTLRIDRELSLFAQMPTKEITDALDESGLSRVESAFSEEIALLEGWALAAAFELVQAMTAGDVVIDIDRLVDDGRIPAELRYWFTNLCQALEESDLAAQVENGWQLVDDANLPNACDVLHTLATDFPQRPVELMLATRITAATEQIAIKGPAALRELMDLPGFTDTLDLSGSWERHAAVALAQTWSALPIRGTGNDPIRLLQIGFGPLSYLLADLTRSQRLMLTIIEPDPRRRDRVQFAFADSGAIEIVDSFDMLEPAQFDAALASGTLHRGPFSHDGLKRVTHNMKPGALLLALEPTPSLFRDIVCGLAPDWFDRHSFAGFAMGPLSPPEQWQSTLDQHGWAEIAADTVMIGNDKAIALLARAAGPAARATPNLDPDPIAVGIFFDRDDPRMSELAAALSSLLQAQHARVTITVASSSVQPPTGAAFDHIIHLGHRPTATRAEAIAADQLRTRCLGLKRFAEGMSGKPRSAWIATHGAFSVDSPCAAVETGVWAFSRTVANEFPSLPWRRVDLGSELTVEVAAQKLAQLLTMDSAETEVILDAGGMRAVRGESRPIPHRGQTDSAAAMRLQRPSSGGLDRLRWAGCDRPAPADHEVEIEVAATGLNFRDVMFSMSLLPEDILEDGFAGPTLGLECSGTVLRVGAQVHDLKPGDQVLAFAPSAFSTHVTVAEAVVSRLPSGLTLEAAATIPVAFSTAYYALINLAQLKADEWVLIHGGAGGVGLAALQIARWRGARIIATAGSLEKRTMLRLLGADHALDSRSLDFVDQVKAITQSGVHVILNSLAGAAMERSLSTLRPFGRFVELGKRDYVANTHIGLRPFRRNLSYFGVDLDQLLLHSPHVSRQLFRDVMVLFEQSELTPLPYRVFPAVETVEAFRLMQQSGHVGKVIITPPPIRSAETCSRQWIIDPERTHLITGGFGGFGAEAVRWLVRGGARHIAVISRSGEHSDEAKALCAEIAAAGAKLRGFACDISDGTALAATLAIITEQMPPLAGVMHAAMVLDDAIIANLDDERFDRVALPKVLGALNLDALLVNTPLDYLVLFSSATTLIGNAGQGNYVAANGFLEGWSRQQRQRGRPALAIAWGAIGDVGVLARNQQLKERLVEGFGLRAIDAAPALDAMARAFARIDDAVIAIAPIDWGVARKRLVVLNSPTFGALVREGDRHDADAAAIDLRSLIAKEGVEAARQLVDALVLDDISRVLRLPKDDISPFLVLSDAGLDSLMAVELAVGLQKRFGLDAPLSASANGLTVNDIVQQLLALAQDVQYDRSELAAQAVINQHLDQGVDADALAPLAMAMTRRQQELKGLLE